MTPDELEAHEQLTASMWARCSDLANYMRVRGIGMSFKSGTTPNGTPVTIFMAVNEHAEVAADVAQALIDRAAERMAEQKRIAGSN